MFTISLHNVKVFAPLGLYPQELILSNRFEVDIDIQSEISDENGRFVDYTILNNIIQNVFKSDIHTLEKIAQAIHSAAFEQFPFIKQAKVIVRKMKPPMPGEIAYAQVVFEK